MRRLVITTAVVILAFGSVASAQMGGGENMSPPANHDAQMKRAPMHHASHPKAHMHHASHRKAANHHGMAHRHSRGDSSADNLNREELMKHGMQ